MTTGARKVNSKHMATGSLRSAQHSGPETSSSTRHIAGVISSYNLPSEPCLCFYHLPLHILLPSLKYLSPLYPTSPSSGTHTISARLSLRSLLWPLLCPRVGVPLAGCKVPWAPCIILAVYLPASSWGVRTLPPTFLVVLLPNTGVSAEKIISKYL